MKNKLERNAQGEKDADFELMEHITGAGEDADLSDIFSLIEESTCNSCGRIFPDFPGNCTICPYCSAIN